MHNPGEGAEICFSSVKRQRGEIYYFVTIAKKKGGAGRGKIPLPRGAVSSRGLSQWGRKFSLQGGVNKERKVSAGLREDVYYCSRKSDGTPWIIGQVKICLEGKTSITTYKKKKQEQGNRFRPPKKSLGGIGGSFLIWGLKGKIHTERLPYFKGRDILRNGRGSGRRVPK